MGKCVGTATNQVWRGCGKLSRRTAKPASDEWVRRIHGSHKQVIDASMPNGGFQPVFALNFGTSNGQPVAQ